MNRKPILFAAAIIVIVAMTALVFRLKTHQRLGEPGIKATPIPNSVVMKIGLPANVLDFASTNLTEAEAVTNMLPKDTSYAQCSYSNSESIFPINANIILMGKDRTSIHKPEYCLPGQGFRILSKTNVSIPIADNPSYNLEVAKWTVARSFKDEAGRTGEIHGLYVFWFVADHEQTCSHWERIFWLSRDLLTRGVLQRWAYVSYFTLCMPGQEDAAFDRVRRLIAESVPQFQLPQNSENSDAVARK